MHIYFRLTSTVQETKTALYFRRKKNTKSDNRAVVTPKNIQKSVVCKVHCMRRHAIL